jgi:hypothetical protein
MANTSEEPVADGKRFKLDSFRITVLAILASGIYGTGIIAAMWAAHASVVAAHSDRSIPALPWVIAFVFVVGGMLMVIYGFFFRPRELRVSATQVALVNWDGNGKKMRRDEVRTVEIGPRRILLRGTGKTLVVPGIFRDWERIREELSAWGGGT